MNKKMSGNVFNENNFENDVLKNEGKVLVDFYADWCGPCKMMGPVIEQISNEMGDLVKVGKINVDENGSIAQEYNVMSIPTIMVFKNGNPVRTFIGVTDKNEIIDAIKSL